MPAPKIARKIYIAAGFVWLGALLWMQISEFAKDAQPALVRLFHLEN